MHERLRRQVLEGRFPVGSKLPPERALARELEVNRETIRAALGRLRAEGLLAARQGSGHTVLDLRREGGLELLGPLLELRDPRPIARDLLAIRRALAALLVERLTEPRGDLRAVEAALADFEAAVAAKEPPAAIADADLEVVGALLDASGSVALQLCWSSLARVVRDFPQLRDAVFAQPERSVIAYRALLAWLRRDADAPLDPAPLLAAMAERDAQTLAQLEDRLDPAHSSEDLS